MNKKQLIAVWGIIFLISSVCFAKEYKTPELINGVTTQQGVIKDFRKPDEVRKDKSGNTIWVFKNAIKMERVDNGEEYPNSALVLTFNKNGILVNSDIKPIDEDIQKSERLDKVCELLESKSLTKEQRAQLLYEKSHIMLTEFWVGSLRSGTETLLEAIELAPQNQEYKDFLCQEYDKLWKDRDFNDGGEFSKDFQALKEKVKIKVEQYRRYWDEKEDEFFAALRVTQGNHSEAELHQAIGYWLLDSYNQWERAAVHFKEAVELDPKLYMSWYNLGFIYIDSEEGYNYFKKTTEANPNFAAPYYWMAYYRCRYREDKKAIPLFKKYLEVAEAKKDPQEEGRIKAAKEVLADLIAGKEGQELKMMRKPE